MVQIKKHPRNNRADYFAPVGYIDSSNMVSGVSEPALDAFERISCWSVPLIDVVAYRTGLGRVRTGHEYKRYSCKSGFVLDETTQLPECPGRMSATLCLSNRCPGSDTVEVFDGNHSASVFCFSHNLPGNNMILMPVEPALPSGKGLEVSFSTPGSCTLELQQRQRDRIYHFAG